MKSSVTLHCVRKLVGYDLLNVPGQFGLYMCVSFQSAIYGTMPVMPATTVRRLRESNPLLSAMVVVSVDGETWKAVQDWFTLGNKLIVDSCDQVRRQIFMSLVAKAVDDPIFSTA